MVIKRKMADFIEAKQKCEKNGLYKGIETFGGAKVFENNSHDREVMEITAYYKDMLNC